MDCFANKLQDNGAVHSFEEQSDSGGGQFFSTVGTRMFSTSLQVPVLSLAMWSMHKMKDPRPIIVTTLTDNCPSTKDGPTVTQLNPNLLRHAPTRRTCISTNTVVPTSPQLFVIAASHPLFTTLNRHTHMSIVFPTCHRLFVVSTTLCTAPVYQSQYCTLLTQPTVRLTTSIQFFPHFSHPPYALYFTSSSVWSSQEKITSKESPWSGVTSSFQVLQWLLLLYPRVVVRVC
jgi:hypothetical protein